MRIILAGIAVTICLCSVHTGFAQDAIHVNWSLDDDQLVFGFVQPATLVGLDVISATASLVPADGDDSSPFMFFLSNTPANIVWASLPDRPSELAGRWETGVGFSGPSSAVHEDLIVSVGGGPASEMPSVFYCPTRIVSDGGCLLPEPCTARLLFVPLVGLGLFRKRRR